MIFMGQKSGSLDEKGRDNHPFWNIEGGRPGGVRIENPTQGKPWLFISIHHAFPLDTLFLDFFHQGGPVHI